MVHRLLGEAKTSVWRQSLNLSANIMILSRDDSFALEAPTDAEDQISPTDFQKALDWLTGRIMLDLQESREPVAKNLVSLQGSLGEVARRLRLKGANYLAGIIQSPRSPGYEPLLIKRGETPVLARMKAFLTVNEGKRIAAESRGYRRVADGIRSLARPNCSRRAVARNIEILFAASQQTRIIRTIFNEAELSASAAHELFLFDPRPASRRLNARRQLAGVPAPARNAKGGSQKSR
jgi:hypothetical protein